jgi:hypothetical protein
MRIEGCLASPNVEACIWMGWMVHSFFLNQGRTGAMGARERSSVLSKVSEGCRFARFYAHNVA